MKKQIRYTTYLSFIVIALFTFAMLATYFGEFLQLSGFFGDTLFNIPTDNVDRTHIWGTRHYWYYWMCIILFLISILRIIFWSIHYFNKI